MYKAVIAKSSIASVLSLHKEYCFSCSMDVLCFVVWMCMQSLLATCEITNDERD